jgi:hypothetical protein
VRLEVLDPEELEGDLAPLELLVDVEEVRERPELLASRGCREEPRLESPVVQVVGKRPAEAGAPGAADVFGDRPHAERAGAGDLPVEEVGLELESQDIS